MASNTFNILALFKMDGNIFSDIMVPRVLMGILLSITKVWMPTKMNTRNNGTLLF